MSNEELLDQASELIHDLAGRWPEMSPIYPNPPDSQRLGLVSQPVASIACLLAVAPGQSPLVFLSFEAVPLYCPGPFYMVEPIGRSRTVRQRFRSIRFPEVDVSAAARPTSLAAASFALEKEYPPFRSGYGTPEKLMESLRWEEDIDCWEAFAFSMLETRQYEDAGREFQKIADLQVHNVDRADVKRLPELQNRAHAALRLISQGPEAVAGLLANTKRKKLAAFGLSYPP
jgi:hypothetical protein